MGRCLEASPAENDAHPRFERVDELNEVGSLEDAADRQRQARFARKELLHRPCIVEHEIDDDEIRLIREALLPEGEHFLLGVVAGADPKGAPRPEAN